jgi:hypothetical protein
LQTHRHFVGRYGLVDDVIFNKTPTKSFMQVLYRGTHWLRFWSLLESDEQDKEMFTSVCQKIEVVAMQIFTDHG